jgi:hypothetical protein
MSKSNDKESSKLCLKYSKILKDNGTNFNLYSEIKFHFKKLSLFNKNNLNKRISNNYDEEKYFELHHCKIDINNT